MLSSCNRLRVAVGAAAVVSVFGTPLFAQNVALRKPIVDGSGAYGTEPYYRGAYNAFHVTDGAINEPVSPSNFWIDQELFDGQGYFTVDLGDQYAISQIDLRNTHNGQYNDRGTANFEIYGSNAINAARQLVSPTLVTSGTLTQRSGSEGDTSPIPADTFAASGTYRYLRFNATSAYGSTYNNPGLNEIEVTGTRQFANPAPGTNVALNKPVVTSSGSYPYTGFEAQNVTDGSTSDVFADGANVGSSSYWLTPDGTGANSFFVLDLQEQFNVTGIGLRNTHNTQHNDRGTLAFEIRASNDPSGDLAGAPVVLAGGLPNVSGEDPIELFQFAQDNGLVVGDYRYLRFNILSAIGNNGGLNEIEVYGTPVPEPTAAAVLGLAALAGLSRRRRRN